MSKIAIIVGSVRPRRLGLSIARWVADVGKEVLGASIEVIDLRDWPLPMDEEPEVPARGQYDHEHTRAWSREIEALDAIVFVTPQYNWGYPAPLKNAIDHIYAEWSGKAALIVTYGGHGGDKCGAQLRQVLEAVKMRTVDAMPQFVLPRTKIESNDGEIDAAAEFGAHAEPLRNGFHQLATALGGSSTQRLDVGKAGLPGRAAVRP